MNAKIDIRAEIGEAVGIGTGTEIVDLPDVMHGEMTMIGLHDVTEISLKTEEAVEEGEAIAVIVMQALVEALGETGRRVPHHHLKRRSQRPILPTLSLSLNVRGG